jgi:MATE family multidrug resistance protein
MRSLNSQILRLALPSILANITIPLVGVVDTAIVGHIANATYIGGIAIGTMLFDLLYWNFGFLRVGTSGMTAQAYGRGDRIACARLLTQSVAIALIGAAIIWCLQWVFVTVVLSLVPCSEEVAIFAREYFFVRIWAAPATLSLMAFKGWFIGMQDTVSPMIADVVVNVVNMVVSYVLAVYTPLGAIGVAYGTLIAQLTGLLLVLIIFLIKYRHIGQEMVRLLGDKANRLLSNESMRTFMSLNGNLFIRSLCFMVVYVGFTSLASKYGDVELAISTIMMKLFMLFSYFVDGFAYAGEALVGKEIGAKQHHGRSAVDRVVHYLFAWSLGVGVLFTLLFGIWSGECYRAMTNDMTVLSRLTDYTGWLIAMPIVSTLAFMWDGVYAGATAGKHIRNAMICAASGFVVCYIATYWWLGVQGLYIAYFAHLVARVVYLTLAWKRVKWRTDRSNMK